MLYNIRIKYAASPVWPEWLDDFHRSELQADLFYRRCVNDALDGVYGDGVIKIQKLCGKKIVKSTEVIYAS